MGVLNIINTTFLLLIFHTVAFGSLVNSPSFGTPCDLNMDIREPYISIKKFKSIHEVGQYETIAKNTFKDFPAVTIKGVVIANDQSGNFYKSIIIQDETAGIKVLINRKKLYEDFPIGATVSINCNGLVMGDFNNLIQLGGFYDKVGDRVGGIDKDDIGKVIRKMDGDRGIKPKVKTIEELDWDDMSTLVEIQQVEFIGITANVTTFAEPHKSMNHELSDCGGQVITLRNNSYAEFQTERLPVGNGTIIGVVSAFGNDFKEDRQLFIRDLSDIDFKAEPCVISNKDLTETSIQAVRDLYQGKDIQATKGKKIIGVVISDFTQRNLAGKNIVIQNQDGAGITIRFDDLHQFPLGGLLEIDISEAWISEYNGLLQLNNLSLEQAMLIGESNIEPELVSIEKLLEDFEKYESELVKISNVEFPEGGVYRSKNLIRDATGTIGHWTTKGSFPAKFMDVKVPSEKVDIIAIASQFKTPQLNLRGLYDVSKSGIGTAPVKCNGLPRQEIAENFQTLIPNGPINIACWSAIAEEGKRMWSPKEFKDNIYLEASAYNDTSPKMVSWLVSPPIDLAKANTLTFESAKNYYVQDGLSVLFSTDYTGDIRTATWKELEGVRMATESDPNHTFISSGKISLPGNGTGHLAFRYKGDHSSNTGTFRIDNILIE